MILLLYKSIGHCGSAVLVKDVMKKDDKQPDKPKKKPLKKAASKPSANKKPKQQDEKPIEIILPAKPKHPLNLDAKKYRDSLSVELLSMTMTNTLRT